MAAIVTAIVFIVPLGPNLLRCTLPCSRRRSLQQRRSASHGHASGLRLSDMHGEAHFCLCDLLVAACTRKRFSTHIGMQNQACSCGMYEAHFGFAQHAQQGAGWVKRRRRVVPGRAGGRQHCLSAAVLDQCVLSARLALVAPLGCLGLRLLITNAAS